MLSIDVCLGALAGGIMAAQLLQTDPGWAYWIVLPLAVWLIYTSDHLIDGFRTGKKAIKERYVVHQKYKWQFIIIASLLSIVTAFISFSYLSNNIILFGIILGSMAAAYLFLVYVLPGRKMHLFQKEMAVAFFYSAGIWGPVIIIGPSISWVEGLIVVLFYILAFCDLIMLSVYEIKEDEAEGLHSLPLSIGIKSARRLFHLLALVVLTVSGIIILTNPSWIMYKASFILGSMSVCLVIIFNTSRYFRDKELYRYISEAVFILPVLMLI